MHLNIENVQKFFKIQKMTGKNFPQTLSDPQKTFALFSFFSNI